MALLELVKITKAFDSNFILSDVDLKVESGQVVAIVGPSGSGKSTLLHIAGLLDRPDGGQVFIDGLNCTDWNRTELAAVRRNYMGFIYQFHHLLSEFTVSENLEIAQRICTLENKAAIELRKELIAEIGLSQRMHHSVTTLSGGEQQRVAIARSLATSPKLVLADEPTGSLDTDNATKVFELFVALAKERNVAVVMATHNKELASKCQFVFALNHGVLEEV